MLDILEKSNYEVNMGGSWAPRDCQARHKVTSLNITLVCKNLNQFEIL